MYNFEEYFKELGCDYWYEYDSCYGDIDFKDKIVINVGGDCGSSALYFVMKGASKVIAYEKDDELRNIFYNVVLKDFPILKDKVIMNGEWKGEYPDGDIFIIDCEGCESILDFDKLNKYKIVLVAIHIWTEDKKDLFKKMIGWKLKYVSKDGKELTFMK